MKIFYFRYKPSKTETYQFDNFQCPHCQRLFSARAGLKIHVGIAHRGVSIVFCPRCPLTFKTVQDCKAHLKTAHSGKKNYIRKGKPIPEPEVIRKSAVPSNIPICYASSKKNAPKVNDEISTNPESNPSEIKIKKTVESANTADNCNQNQVEIKIEKGDEKRRDEVAQKEIVIQEETFDIKSEILEALSCPVVVLPSKPRKPLPALLKITASDLSKYVDIIICFLVYLYLSLI